MSASSEKKKEKLIDQLRQFINSYDLANIKEIVKSVYGDVDEETIAEFQNRDLRFSFYDEVELELSQPIEPAKPKEKQEGGGREEELEQKEKLSALLHEHDEHIEMMKEVVNELEAAETTQGLLEECQVTRDTLQAELGRLGSQGPPPLPAKPKKESVSRPSALTVPTASVTKVSVKSSTLSQKPGRRLVPTSTGRMTSVRIGCADRTSQTDCVLDETKPCHWVPGNEPPCLTNGEYVKVSRKGSIAAAASGVTPSQRASASRVSVAVPTTTSSTKASTKAITKSTRGGTLEELKAEAYARVRPHGAKGVFAFNNYLRTRYQDEYKTLSRLTVSQFHEILALTPQEIAQRMEDPITLGEEDQA